MIFKPWGGNNPEIKKLKDQMLLNRKSVFLLILY